MDLARRRFNLYLAAALCGLLTCGCASRKNKVPDAQLRVHIEATDSTTFPQKIKLENPPVTMKVDKSTLLTEVDVKEAKVVEALGGFALEIEFDKRGQWLLDQYSSINRGRHLAVYAKFGRKPAKSAWIAAPRISHRIADGKLIFTPNLTREEAELMTQGLGSNRQKKKPREFNE